MGPKLCFQVGLVLTLKYSNKREKTKFCSLLHSVIIYCFNIATFQFVITDTL